MAIKKTTYVIEIDTSSGKVKIDGLTKGFVEAENAAKKFNSTLAQTEKSLGQKIDKTGLAGAAVVELGRTISDANYGITAMANNISQLSTLMVTLIATTGGLKKGMLALWDAFKGPLGLIVVFQIVVALLERMAIANKSASKSINDVEKAYKNAATELELLLKLDTDLTETQKANIEQRISMLKEEAKVRAQIAQIQKLQSDLIEVEMKQTADFVPWYQAIWQSIKTGDAFTGGPLRSDAFITSVLGIGEENKEEQRQAILKSIDDIVNGIDPEALDNVINKSGKSKKRADLKHTSGKGFGLVLGDLLTDEYKTDRDIAIDKELKAGQAFLDKELDMLQESHDFKKALREGELDAEKLAFESKLQMLDAYGMGLNAIGYLLGESTQEGKAIAAAGALIDTYAAINKTLKLYGGTPLGWAQSAAIGLAGFANVKQIYSVKVPKSSGGTTSSSSIGATEIQAPDFNIVGGSGINQLKETITEALSKPSRAYITTKDVRTAAELDRNIVSGATVG